MPAMGAAAAYKRMRCGFEDSVVSIAPKVLGNYGDEVTAVLANSPGGLELLPSQAYGNDWLRVTHGEQTLLSLPKRGDPYEEIYKLRGKWYGLLKEEWINPAGHNPKRVNFVQTCKLLDRAKEFHNDVAGTYHDQSYAHYGADSAHATWHRVTWDLENWAHPKNVDDLRIQQDDRQGRLHVLDSKTPSLPGTKPTGLSATMQAPREPGDQTVPLHSAEHQLRSGKFKGIFRQTGYEHQASYNNDGALHSTMYSLISIARTMVWNK